MEPPQHYKIDFPLIEREPPDRDRSSGPPDRDRLSGPSDRDRLSGPPDRDRLSVPPDHFCKRSFKNMRGNAIHLKSCQKTNDVFFAVAVLPQPQVISDINSDATVNDQPNANTFMSTKVAVIAA